MFITVALAASALIIASIGGATLEKGKHGRHAG